MLWAASCWVVREGQRWRECWLPKVDRIRSNWIRSKWPSLCMPMSCVRCWRNVFDRIQKRKIAPHYSRKYYNVSATQSLQTGCSYDQGFKAELISWIQKSLIPPLRETVQSDYLFQLEAAVKMPCLTEGGQLQHLMSQDAQDNPVANTLTAALPVASTSNFAKYQHQRDCCGYCAAPCNRSELQGCECNCGAICCSDCYGHKCGDKKDLVFKTVHI